MSGIYIPWMSMPKTCDDCQVSADCPNDEHIDGYNMQNRPRFCQLVPIPSHGDLIERDGIISIAYRDKSFGGFWGDRMAIKYVEECANNAPVIIPAEEEGE